MKELKPNIPETTKLQIEVQQEKQQRFVGSIKRHPGHTVFQIDLKTQEITVAEFSEEVFNMKANRMERKIITKENHWYCSALNKQSAFKRFNNWAKFIVEAKRQ